MIDTFDSITGWTADTGAANIALETSTINQGTGSLEFDKTGTANAYAGIYKDLPVPIDIQYFRQMGGLLKLDFYHADFTGIENLQVRLLYDYVVGGTAKYENFDSATPSAGAWNTLSVSLNSPTSSSGSPTDADRRHCVRLHVYGFTDVAATTWADLFVDALRITGVPHACLIFGSNRLLVPPFDVWNRNREDRVALNETELRSELVRLTSKEVIQAGIRQTRVTHSADSQIHALEDSLYAFDQYIGSNVGWGLARKANEVIDTTLNGAVAAGATTGIVTSATDFAWQGMPADIRLGPNDSGQVERVRVMTRSGTTVRFDRALQYAHESGTPVRSLGYYPSLARRGSQSSLRETGSAVAFDVTAVPTE